LVSIAGVKPAKEEEEEEKPLAWVAVRQVRSGAARANYLAQDRADLSYAAKELCRRMSAPTEADWVALLRIVRYLKAEPRGTYRYLWQKDSAISVYVDTDFAGCPLRLGKALLEEAPSEVATWSNIGARRKESCH